jgi:hypothetical protein
MSGLALAHAPRIFVGELLYGAITACAVGFIACVTLFSLG